MARRDTDVLIEQAVSAWRARSPDGTIPPHAAWADLAQAKRMLLFEETLRWRAVEQALDVEELSATCHAILARITRKG